MMRLTWLELLKIAARPRSYIGFAVIFIFCTLVQFALYADGMEYIQFVTQNVEQSFVFEGKILNGSLVCFVILQALILQIPLLVALVTGDLVSGEAAMGTLRLWLTRPASRSSILFSKYFAGQVYTFLILLWLGVLALGVSLLVFGEGDLIALKTDELVIIPANDVLWRFFAALAMAFLALSLVGALSMLLSCYSDNSIGPIITTMAIIILFTIIGSLDVPLFEKIRPYLFTTHMNAWRSFFEQPIPWSQIRDSSLFVLAHIVVFLGVSLYHFNRKDILT